MSENNQKSADQNAIQWTSVWQNLQQFLDSCKADGLEVQYTKIAQLILQSAQLQDSKIHKHAQFPSQKLRQTLSQMQELRGAGELNREHSDLAPNVNMYL